MVPSLAVPLPPTQTQPDQGLASGTSSPRENPRSRDRASPEASAERLLLFATSFPPNGVSRGAKSCQMPRGGEGLLGNAEHQSREMKPQPLLGERLRHRTSPPDPRRRGCRIPSPLPPTGVPSSARKPGSKQAGGGGQARESEEGLTARPITSLPAPIPAEEGRERGARPLKPRSGSLRRRAHHPFCLRPKTRPHLPLLPGSARGLSAAAAPSSGVTSVSPGLEGGPLSRRRQRALSHPADVRMRLLFLKERETRERARLLSYVGAEGMVGINPISLR